MSVKVIRTIEPKEGTIQSRVLNYLARKKHFFWRNNTTGIYDPKTKRYRKMPKYAKPGAPDIILIKDGFFIGLEIKKKGGYQSKDQKEFEKGVKAAGGEYYVIRKVEDLTTIGL